MVKKPRSLSAAPSRGRPREFEIDDALDKAVRVFCERGYHATSINDLTEATQLTAGSIYKAFNDKRGVFLAALSRYKTVRDAKLGEAINTGKTGIDRLRLALTFYAEASHGADGRQGCLVVGSAAELATFDEEVAQWVAAAIARIEKRIGELIRHGQMDGSIPVHIDCDATARLMLCLIQGMRLVGKTGRNRKEMADIVEIAMKTLG